MPSPFESPFVDSPSRRELLAVGATTLTATLSGCLSGALSGRPTVREKSGEVPNRSVPPAISGLSANATVTTLAVGRGSDSHQVWVWNETGEPRDVAVRIADRPDADPWFRGTYALDANARLAIDLRAARRYAVAVLAGGREATVEVPKSRFDCNDSATDVAIRESGIETKGVSTDMACGGL